MKLKFLFLAVTLAVTAQIGAAQNTLKIFDGTAIDVSIDDQVRTFASKQVYVSCPAGVPVQASLTGPNGGPFAVDNAIQINGAWAGGSEQLFAGVVIDPMFYVGERMEMSYISIQPLDVSGQVNGTGVYTFDLVDWGYTLGSTDLYLNSSCSISLTPPASDTGANQVCHRNMGTAGWKTLTVGPNAISAHLAHGDTLGPCQ